DRVFGWAEQAGDEDSQCHMLQHLTELECRAGDWSRAEALAERHWRACEQMGEEYCAGPPQWSVSKVQALLGRLDRARVVAADGARLAAEHRVSAFQMHNTCVLGLVELSAGNYAAAAAHLRVVADWQIRAGW